MKLYIWQNTPATKWHIYFDFDHPLGRELTGKTQDLFTRTHLECEGVDRTATFRINPHNGVGELFTQMTFYQMLLAKDYRTESKENCILQSTGKWLVQHANLEGIHTV